MAMNPAGPAAEEMAVMPTMRSALGAAALRTTAFRSATLRSATLGATALWATVRAAMRSCLGRSVEHGD